MFERETKREKVLEAKNREMRLKNRAGGFISVFRNHKKSTGIEKKENLEAVEDPIAKAEKDFFEIVNKVITNQKSWRQWKCIFKTGKGKTKRSSQRNSHRAV